MTGVLLRVLCLIQKPLSSFDIIVYGGGGACDIACSLFSIFANQHRVSDVFEKRVGG